MADVFAATRRGEGGRTEVVALKRIRRELSMDSSFRRMFLDEARIARLLDHPNIVRLLDVGGEAETTYLVMEFVKGLNVRALVDQELLSSLTAIRIAAVVAEALHTAHEQTDDQGVALNIVHRDVTPMNVMVTTDGEVKLLDFGIAVARGRAERTQAGFIKGKWSYLSPEQVVGEEVDRRSDIFTLGSLIYEMITGKLAFPGEEPAMVLRSVVTAEPTPPAQLGFEVPKELLEVIGRCLEKSPDDRYQSCQELSEELEAIAGVWNLLEDESSAQESLEALVRRLYPERVEAIEQMVRQLTSDSSTDLATPAVPALVEERSGDLPSSDPRPPTGEADELGFEATATALPSSEPELGPESEEILELDPEEEPEQEQLPFGWAILFGFLLGGVLAVVVWYVGLGG